MAINKTAKNLYITIDQKYYSIVKKIIETAEKVLHSNKKVQLKGNK